MGFDLRDYFVRRCGPQASAKRAAHWWVSDHRLLYVCRSAYRWSWGAACDKEGATLWFGPWTIHIVVQDKWGD